MGRWCALTQVLLGKVLLGFCKEGLKQRVAKLSGGKAVIFSSLRCLFPGEFKTILHACGGSKKWFTCCFPSSFVLSFDISLTKEVVSC